jgi:hypothetical protein
MAGTGELELLASSAVREHVTDDDLERLAAKGAAGYQCAACKKRAGPADGPASVGVLLDAAPGGGCGGFRAVVRLGHAACCDSQVTTAGAPLAAPAVARMLAKAGVLSHPAGDRPVLVTELATLAVAVTGPGERADLATGELLGLGLHLLASPWEPAPPARGWVALLSPAKAVIIDRDGGRYYAGAVDYPLGWLDLAAQRRAVELLAGADGIDGPAGAVAGALEAAAAAGRLAGGLMPAGRAR